MAENENRGPNDFRARNGKRRREPPIIDASATEVPLDARDSVPDADGDPAVGVHASGSDPGGPQSGSAEASEPVLFGSALRDAAPKTDAAEPSAVAPAEAVTAAEGPTPVAPAAGSGSVASNSFETKPFDGKPFDGKPFESGSSPIPSTPIPPAGSASASSTTAPTGGSDDRLPPAAAAARSGGGAIPWLLGLCSLALLGALTWVLYTEPQRSGGGEIADLRARVAGLEARPDPGAAAAGVEGLDKRLTAADAERAGLGKSIADLSARLDAVAQKAQAARDSDKATPAAEAPSGAAAAATVGALGALAARLEGLDGRVAALATAQGDTAKAVGDLPKPVAPDFGPVNAKLAALDGQVNALDGKMNGSDARLNGFDAKVNAVDSKINGFEARMNGFENRTNGIEAKANETAAGLGQVEASVAKLPRVDLAPLQASTAALDGRVAKIEGQLSAPKDGSRSTEARAVGSADEARATPLALVGQSVAVAIADGRPYGADLDALKALGAAPATVAKLDPLAAKGAPTAAALRDQWEAVQGSVLAAVKPAEPGSAFDRFATGARSLVQVRRVGAVQGDDPAALVSQVDGALASGDVAGALAAWDKLPQAGQDRSRDWAAAARGRVAAATAAQDVVNGAIATLGKTKS